MTEAKKRFPWRLLACAVLLVILAAVLGFIETVGRRGTIVGRFERLAIGMPETEVRTILGPGGHQPDRKKYLGQPDSVWQEGPVDVRILWMRGPRGWHVCEMNLRGPEEDYPIWHVRRWAEKAWTTIHGARR